MYKYFLLPDMVKTDQIDSYLKADIAINYGVT